MLPIYIVAFAVVLLCAVLVLGMFVYRTFRADALNKQRRMKLRDRFHALADSELNRMQRQKERDPTAPFYTERLDEVKYERGIVICAGGPYIPCAYVTVRRLRDVGCALPIQWWYAGPGEMDKEAIAALKQYNVECVDACAVAREMGLDDADCTPAAFRGYQIKPFAVMCAPMRHVMLIDADNASVRDPSFLFDTEQYQRTGALFWPDYWQAHGDKHMMNTYRVTDFCQVQIGEHEYEQESGQMVVNRERALPALRLCWFMNLHRAVFYRMFMGDKDTFHVAFRRLGLPFVMNPFAPGSLGYMKHNRFWGDTMVQYDFEGKPLFCHRTLSEWRLNQKHRTWFHLAPSGSISGLQWNRIVNDPKKGQAVPAPGDIQQLEVQALRHLEELRTMEWAQRLVPESKK